MPEVDQYVSDFETARQNTHKASNTTSDGGILTNFAVSSGGRLEIEPGAEESGCTGFSSTAAAAAAAAVVGLAAIALVP